MLTVSHPSPLASWYQFYCLENRDTRALVACPELLVRKLVESGIEPATLRSTGRNLNHTTANCPPQDWGFNPFWVLQPTVLIDPLWSSQKYSA